MLVKTATLPPLFILILLEYAMFQKYNTWDPSVDISAPEHNLLQYVAQPTVLLDDPLLLPDMPRIPKVLHFVYLAPQLNVKKDVFPAEITKSINNAERLHPDWTIVRWNNTMIRDEFADLVPLLVQIPRPMAWVANLVRYAILEKHGGIYMDTDFDVLHPLDDLVNRYSNFTVCELPKNRFRYDRSRLDDPAQHNEALHHAKRIAIHDDESTITSSENSKLVMSMAACEQVSNAVIGVAPHNPAIQHVLQTAIENTLERLSYLLGRGSYSIKWTGPPLWTISATLYDVTVLYDQTFFPCPWETRFGDCGTTNQTVGSGKHDTYAKHMWSLSWRQHKPSRRERLRGVKIDENGFVVTA
jgi:hypothetical protein